MGKKPPTLYVLDLKRGNVKAVKGLPTDSSVGQPEWTSDGKPFVGRQSSAACHLRASCCFVAIAQ